MPEIMRTDYFLNQIPTELAHEMSGAETPLQICAWRKFARGLRFRANPDGAAFSGSP